MRIIAASVLATLPFMAFADPMVVTVTSDNTLRSTPTSWLGEMPHLVIMGFVNGFPFDLQILDLDAANFETFAVTREYGTGAEKPPYQEVGFELVATIEGVTKKIEGKVNHADFMSLALPVTLDLQEQENPDGSAAYTEFGFQWAGLGFPVNEAIGDWAGIATIAMDSAMSSDVPTDEGLVGGYIEAASGENFLVISYTLPVSEAAIIE